MKNPTYFCLTVLLSLFCMNAFAQIQLNGTYLIQNKQNRQNVISPSWENFNVRMYASDVVYPDHQWVFTHLGGGKHSIQNVASGRYMTAQNAGCNLGINITSTTNINGDESRWLIEKRGSNYFIKPAHCTTHAIDKKGGNNGSVHLWQFNANNSNQHFDLISVTPINTQQAGEWSPIYEADMIPVAAAHLADGKILAWSSDGRFSFGSSGKTYTSIFDPADNSFSTTLVNNTGHNMFCPGIANTADGDIIVTGGSTSRKTTIYDVSSNSFKAGPNMNTPRGYHSMVTLNDGRVFAIGGSWSGGRFNKQAEVWTESTGWLSLANVDSEKTIRQGAPDPQGIYRDDNHAWLWAAPNSQVFQAGPGTNMHWINTIDQGGVTDAGLRGDDKYSMNGTSVMFDQGKILTMGGAESYGGRTNASNRSYVVDINGGQANVSRSGDMKQARVYHNSIVLPSGEVVAIGGMCKSAIFSDECASLNVDIWNPETGNWTAGAAMQVPRTYHSVAILMQDGRVWAAGGGLCGGCAVNHADAEIYSPPYLFDDNGLAARPTITNAPATADYSTDINVKTDKAVQDFVLVRMSSVTHSSNNEQRRIPLTFTDKGANNYTLNIPNKDWLPPGNYFLFALDNGVPSVAKIIKVGKNTLPGEEQLVEDGVYFIEALLTGQHLTSPTFDPNNVRMVAASEAGDQKWEITHLENNIYNIKNIQSDRFLNVASASCANDANVITSTNSSATNSRWIISKQGEEFFFRPLHCSTRAMDYQRDPNKNTVIWDFSIGNNNQRFIIKPATTTQVPEGFLTIDGVYLIKNRVNAQNVISTAANNFDVRMFSSANASQDHQWLFRYLGQGRHSVQNASSGRYMSVQNAGCDRGINVTTVAALNGDESFWLVEKKGSNHFLKPAHCTTHAMDKTSGDGQSAYIWEFGLNNGNQHFDLIFLEDAPNQLPSASFTATPSSGEAPLPVSFDASTSSDQDGDELTFRWDLGDGNTAFGEKINHIYTTAASYTVRLTVDDGEGQNTTSQIIEVLEVPNKPPTADFTASTTSGEAPLPVRFDASASSDEDGDELSFQWDFGDGNTATGEKVDHLYQSAGSYTVTLLVSDQEDEASSSLSIVVSEPSNYVIIDGTYSIYNPLKGQNAVNPAWDNLNVRLFSSLVIFDDHKWTFEHIGQGKHRIQNVESKQFLSAASNACAEGVNLFSSANINADNGLWFIEAVGDKYLLRPAFCNDFVLASRAGAPNISLLPLDVDDALQQWELISVDQPDSRIEVNGSFFLQSKVNDLHAIAAEGSLQVEMAPSANPSNRHLWVFERIGRFRHTIRNVQTNNYLFVENGECGNGYSVLSSEKLDGNNGIWYVAKRGEDIYLIPAYCTSRVMDLMANATGAQIETYDITDVNQHWELIPQSVQPNQPPVAAFTSSTTNGEAPLPVRFDASTSTDADGDALTFQWAFGDGNTATGETVNHAYQSAGTYTVTLTVSDQQDQSTASQTIVVEEPANYLIIDGTYSIHNSARGQNAVNPAWDNLNVRLFSSLVIFDDHKWTFEHVGQGKHTIVNRESNQFLSAETADCEDGINLYSSSAPEAENGLWYIEAVGQQFLLRPTFCRDYVLGFRSNSPNISLIPFDASDAFQQWELISVDQPDSRIEINGSFFIQSKANDLQAIAAGGGLEVAMAPENAIAGKHKWLFESIGRFKHTIRNLETGNYLFVENGGCSNGFSILSSPDVVRSNGVWYVAKKGDDFYLIPAYCTSRVMDQMDDASASQIETYDIADVNQRWALIDAGGSTQFRASHFVNELTATPIFGKKSELSYYTYQNDARPVHRYTFQHMMEEDEDFVDIGVINANDQYGAQRINYVHDKAKVGRNYYRVKVEYADGTVSYSPFRMVSFETGLDQLKISIAPNPTQEVLNVDLSNFMDKPIHYFISSLSGKVVMHGQFSKDHGEVEVVRLSEVKNGDYIIYLRPESHREIPIQFVILKNY